MKYNMQINNLFFALNPVNYGFSSHSLFAFRNNSVVSVFLKSAALEFWKYEQIFDKKVYELNSIFFGG
ncbi:hypothetical protein [Sphingobacterium sp. LRF_L2]|uniref:hypothetical protein n=1 Tax=Sphingobacterium sp. LRF_L2 TaxID=3369421 RepID=UPI003F62F033